MISLQDFKPAREFARSYGVKALIYGAAGTGKTPILNTAPRPVLLACETGLLSMRNSNIPTFQALDVSKIKEFFDWLEKSSEAKNFDTIGVDSSSQLAEIFLTDAKKRIKHGLQQYGEMAEESMKLFTKLYFMREKHIYLIAKEEIKNLNGTSFRRPYWAGNVLPIEVPHQYDAILHLAKANVPGAQGEVLAFRCSQSYDVLARDRTGQLSEFEYPDFSCIVRKAMQ